MTDTLLFELVEKHFKALEAKDLEAVLAFYQDDIELIDPHYPKVRMQGKDEVFKGLTWSFKTVKKFSFNLINYFENKEGTRASVEYDSIIELFNGKSFKFPQVFIIETKSGMIHCLRAYEPYGPHGVHKLFLTITRFIHKLRGY
jgi:ketosteroid isomerase-like protein